MKKLITAVAMTFCLMVIGVTVYAACNPGSIEYGTPGYCTQADPTVYEVYWRWDPSSDQYVIEGAASWTVGESWCDLSIIGNDCYVTFFPE